MKNVCIITSHPFWSEPLGCGSLMRSRYEVLSRLSQSLSVVYISWTEEECPLPNSATLRVTGRYGQPHIDALRNFVLQNRISTCFFSFNGFSKTAAELPCNTIVEIHDVMHLRQQAFERHGYEPPLRMSKEEELESLARYDWVLCINDAEARYLAENGVKGVKYLPPAMAFTPVPGPADRLSAGLIGSLALPNIDGLEQSIGHIAALPHLVVAGGLSGQRILDRLSPERVERLGVVSDVREFYARITVALSPVRFGGGLKIKVFEALANGKPVIATRHAVEGFPAGIERLVSVEDDFARWTPELLAHTAEVKPSDIAAYFAENFSPDACRKVLEAIT